MRTVDPVSPLLTRLDPGDAPGATPQAVQRCLLCEIRHDGTLSVETRAGDRHDCDWLTSSAAAGVELAVDDVLLVLLPGGPDDRGVALGRVGRYARPAPAEHLRLEAGASLSLVCGEASIDLRADGKVMVRGDDVLVRAKGTKRIRAGSVSIN